MSAAVAGSLIGAATVRRTGLADEAPTRIDPSSAIPSPTSGH